MRETEVRLDGWCEGGLRHQIVKDRKEWIAQGPDTQNVLRHRISTLRNFTTTGGRIFIYVKYSIKRENKW